MTTLHAAILAILVSTTADEPGDIARLAIEGNASSVDMIQSFGAKITRNIEFNGSTTSSTFSYYKAKNAALIVENLPAGRAANILQQGGQVKVVTTQNNQVVPASEVGMIIGDRNRRSTDGDAWEICLFTLPVGVFRTPAYPMYTLSEFAKKARLTDAVWEDLDGNRVAHVSLLLAEEGRSYDAWIDPSLNWMTRKCLHVIRNPEGAVLWNLEFRASDFREAAPSIMVPQSASFQFTLNGSMISKGNVILSEINVNSPSIRLPAMPVGKAETLVLNETMGQTYRVDRRGARLGPPQRLATTWITAALPASLTDAPPRRWIGWALVGVAAIIGGIFLRSLLGQRRLKNE